MRDNGDWTTINTCIQKQVAENCVTELHTHILMQYIFGDKTYTDLRSQNKIGRKAGTYYFSVRVFLFPSSSPCDIQRMRH